MLSILLMATLLTASMAVLAYRTSFAVLLNLAQCAASLCTVLHLAVVCMLLGLIADALTIRKTLQAEGKRTAELNQLRWVIITATAMTTLTLMLAVTVACSAFVINIIRKFPDFGLVFAIMLIVLLLHRININRIYSRLTDSMAAAQRAARRAMTV
ncbi:hypothetical protein VC279_16560 [Xanthomonas sp. WHRI 10064A]|uniref:hypothetical protein n=1 Tax=unclassified Xanthomonas TaxID=2643310 RepID=UPI002B235FFA|nr:MULTISPECIES: hypothetical protein [unclassified Xanthomonas]MEA9587066.1 hypothetical protein [Xanthomonas sp. WHRI 10064B]MEA9616257.1 hypothetical protein [Xanthomonas sp. WHRI 10064A]